MEDQGPYAYPAHEGEVVGTPWGDDIVYGIVEDGNRSSNAHDD